MAYDEDLEHGLRNLEEILQRLDNRVKDARWVKENAPPEAPTRIKEAIIENFPQPKAVPPPAEPAPAPAPEPIPAPEPVKIVEAPKPVEPPIKIPELIKAPEPIKPPEPLKIPEPLKLPETVKLPPPPVKIPEMRPEVLIDVAPGAEPVPAPAPAPKPARKPFKFNRTAVIFFSTGLAIAGVAYQLFVNSAAQRYKAAGRLVQSARNAEAISAYSRIINIYPRSLEAAYSQYAIADIKAVQNDPDAAIEHYEKYLVAAPAGDPKIASARFKIAQIEYKEDRLADAEFLYQNAAIQASEYAPQAAEQVLKIKAVKDQLAAAKKLVAKTPDKAVEAYSAVVAAHPKYAPAAAGLEEARAAMAAAKGRPVAVKRAPAREPVKSRLKELLTKPPKPAPAAKPAAPKTQAEECTAIWSAEQAQGQLNADMMFAKVKFNCDDLRQKVDTCKIARDEAMALQGVPPEARVQMEQEIDPDWTLAKQLEQDARIRAKYETLHCAQLLKSVAY